MVFTVIRRHYCSWSHEVGQRASGQIGDNCCHSLERLKRRSTIDKTARALAHDTPDPNLTYLAVSLATTEVNGVELWHLIGEGVGESGLIRELLLLLRPRLCWNCFVQFGVHCFQIPELGGCKGQISRGITSWTRSHPKLSVYGQYTYFIFKICHHSCIFNMFNKLQHCVTMNRIVLHFRYHKLLMNIATQNVNIELISIFLHLNAPTLHQVLQS